jgi:cytidylate kinase
MVYSFKFSFMNKIIIAIDGHSSCGKSTVAKALSKTLGYTYIDTGAMYRAITLFFLQHHIDYQNHIAVADALKDIRLSFVKSASDEMPQIHLNGINVEDLIRSLEVAGHVSAVAAIPEVRAFAVKQQQEMGKAKGVVMDGRDIGTTVFPNAELKIFMTANPEVRAERRYKELMESNKLATYQEVYDNLIQRDELDSSRSVSPLRKADDAVEVDTSHITREQQLSFILDLAEARIKKT